MATASWCSLTVAWLRRRTHPDMLLKNNVWRQFPGLGTASAIFAAYVVIDAIVPSFGGGHGDHGHGDHGHGDHGVRPFSSFVSRHLPASAVDCSST